MEEKLAFTHFINALKRRKWTAGAVFLATFVLVLLWTFNTKQVYRTSAKIEISRNEPGIVEFSDRRPIQTPVLELLNTQSQILRSRLFMEKVILNIDKALDKNQRLRKAFEEEYSIKSSAKETAGSSSRTPENLASNAGRMLKQIWVEPSTKSSVITITASSRNPDIAAVIANTMVITFEEHNRQKKQKGIVDAVAAINAVIENQQKNVDASRQTLSAYKKEKGIYSLSKEETESLDDATLRLYLEQLPIAEKVVADTRIPYERYKADYTDFLLLYDSEDGFLKYLPTEIMQSSFKTEYDAIREQLNKISLTRGERHPKVLAAIEQLNLKKEAIAKEYQLFMSNIERQYQLAVEKRDDYQQKIRSFDERREGKDETTAELNRLQSQLDTAIRIYNALQEKSKELSALKGIEESGNSISLVDKAYPPRSPAKPNKALNIFLGLVVGGLFGLGFSFVREYMDNTIKSQEDIEDFLGIPLLGAIPFVRNSNNSGTEKEIVVISDPKSLATEAFKTVRTGLFFSSRNNDLKTILITSGGPGEGKTLFAVNLALTIAQNGSKTLLIDADIRKPRVHRILQLDNNEGLTSYLSGNGGAIKTQKTAEDKNLYVITSGPATPNPTELLGSSRMKNLIEEARKKFDKIIIDTPPVMSVSDPLILTGISDGVIQVINFGKSNKNLQFRTRQRISNFGGKIVGAVLNRVDLEKNGGSYYQSYYYSPTS